MKDNGGPAFATSSTRIWNGGQYEDAEGQEGMSLRDWMAGMALQGLTRAWVTQEVDDYLPNNMAVDAYKLADAMIAERGE